VIERGDIRWFRFERPDKRRPVLVLGGRGGDWKRSDGEASEAPSTERDGNRLAPLHATAPVLDPTRRGPRGQ